MNRLLDLASSWPGVSDLADALVGGKRRLLAYGLSGSQKTFTAAALTRRLGVTALYVTATVVHAERAREDFLTLLPGWNVDVFPPLEILPFEVVAESTDLNSRRLAVLDGLTRGDAAGRSRDTLDTLAPRLVVAPVTALQRRLVPAGVFGGAAIRLCRGQELILDDLLAGLAGAGYERVERVEARGEFAVRGGLVDVFASTAPFPLRIEFFGNEIDGLRTFSVETQRSVDNVEDCVIPPARGAVAAAEDLARGLPLVRRDLARASRDLTGAGSAEAAAALVNRVEEHLERLAADPLAPELGQYIPYLWPQLDGLADYLPGDALVFLDEPARLRQVARDQSKQSSETMGAMITAGRLLPGQAALYTDFQGVMDTITHRRVVSLSLLARRTVPAAPDHVTAMKARPVSSFQGQREPFLEEARRLYGRGATVAVVSATADRLARIADGLREYGVPYAMAETTPSSPSAAAVWLAVGSLETGFELGVPALVVVTDAEVFGRAKRPARPRPAREGLRLASYQDLKVGDYVVHAGHGIGRYLGIQTVAIEGVSRDYLFVQYAGEDRLYVPTDQLGLVRKYVGAEADEPRLFKLGGSEWARVKNKVNASVRELAQELLHLYAVRQTTPGHAFGPDTVWQAEFEDTFPYEETPDQLTATLEIKGDMERPAPMDRLLCGDVGYGKTEVAVRAAFKTVMEGKQVAVLVPTTILAQQHHTTFSERVKGYPVSVTLLSRFCGEAEQKAALRALRAGTADIVIGTHRLLQDDVAFKDLGLWIIDEEHRFGVAHKERLKKLRENVHVLTLSATPIPRTMHMALSGTRDMSVIETPPEDRFPVQTFVAEYDEALIADVIRRELDRGGQVFYVQNRVETIERTAARIAALVPDTRLVVGHGQMREDRLERVMLEFLNGEADILVCTTIIESGIDLPNVNTLIVEDADRLGLAQLYQLRGRVGRSNRLAYAYFTFRPDRVLGEAAERRLAAVKEFTELGSGFKIALRDLEIRGAGNLLGAEQHGHILAVGFDLYCQLLEEAVSELKGSRPPEVIEPVIELPVDAYIADSYIRDPRQKIEMYRKIVALDSPEAAADVRAELEDRFGPLPEPVANLLAVARLKAQCRDLGVAAVSRQRSEVLVRFGPMRRVTPADAHRVARLSPDRLSIVPSRTLTLAVKSQGFTTPQLLRALEAVLGRLAAAPVGNVGM